MEKILKS